MVLCSLLLAISLADSGALAPTVLKLGDTLPVADLATLTAEITSTSKFKYPLIISVFTTWCTVCKKELPQLNNIGKEAKDKNIELNIVGIDAGESVNKVSSYQRKQKLDFDLLVDTSLSLIKKLQIKGTPVVLVFNKKGQLTYQGSGIPAQWSNLIL